MEKSALTHNRRAQFFRLNSEISHAGVPVDLSFKKARTIAGNDIFIDNDALAQNFCNTKNKVIFFLMMIKEI